MFLQRTAFNQGMTRTTRSLRYRSSQRPAFTLLELMMAIVILGLGLVMVATMFPVAWTRAKDMSELTARQTIVPTTESTLKGLVPVADKSLTRAGFAGDLIYVSDCNPGWIAAYSDTRVHVLNTQNLLVGGGTRPRGFVAEDPWTLEQIPQADDWITNPLESDALANACPDLINRALGDVRRNITEPFLALSFYTPRVTFGQRWYPPLPSRQGVNQQSLQFTGNDEDWDSRLDTRRFSWAVMHRLRKPVGPVDVNLLIPPAYAPGDPFYVADAQRAAKAAGAERQFDIYYVTLRRTRPTDRYASQDATRVPNPYALAASAAAVPIPRALAPSEDVMMPTPWRVQIEVPPYPDVQLASQATGVPTEVLVPPNNFPNELAAKIMLVQMFAPGTFFVDEINGQVYKVVQRRLVNAEGSEAVLTLDREITLEDLEIPEIQSGVCDPRFATGVCIPLDQANPLADPEELLRTVWVYPPATASRDEDSLFPTFDGPPSVVSIEVRSLSILP